MEVNKPKESGIRTGGLFIGVKPEIKKGKKTGKIYYSILENRKNKDGKVKQHYVAHVGNREKLEEFFKIIEKKLNKI